MAKIKENKTANISYDTKIYKIQEFIDARGSTLRGIRRKFGITPKRDGYPIIVSGREVYFSAHDIDTIYYEFKNVSAEQHGRG